MGKSTAIVVSVEASTGSATALAPSNWRPMERKVSSAARNYRAQGFLARTEAEEIKCPSLELNVLTSMENVTSRVQGVVKPGMSEREALTARRAEMARTEKESLDKTGLRSDIVTLYQGGEYWLYRYKKYTDIRIVFAPEEQIAFFGGDPDNFTYPRYDLDVALFRVYENGKPVRPEQLIEKVESLLKT